MNRPDHRSNTRITSLAFALLTTFAGCNEATCPSGSKEVDGTCQLADIDAVNTQDAGTTPDADLEECDGTFNARGECLPPLVVVGPCDPDAQGKPVCDSNASCAVVSDAAQCTCNEGYEGDGKTCVRNPCLAVEGEAAACGANTECSAESAEKAVCSCAEGYEDCDGASENGCEVSLVDDAANCGACGFACAPGLSCQQGECERKYQSLSLNLGHADRCLLKANGDVYCWGEAIKPPNGPVAATPTKVAVAPTAEVRAGYETNCTRTRDGDRVTCWGKNASAQLGKVDSSLSQNSFEIPGLQSISVSLVHGCALAGGQVYCWGSASGGQLGDGSTSPQSAPARGFDANRPVITALTGKPVVGGVEIAAGGAQSCVRLQSGGVQCWGATISGSPPSTSAYRAEDVRAEGSSGLTGALTDAKSVCAGFYHACALRETGDVVCWNSEPTTLLGVTTLPQPNRFRTIALPNVTQVACGTTHVCAVNDVGNLYCWGSNNYGQLGIGTSEASRALPTRVPTLSDVAEVYAGMGTCARLRNGRTYCWGDSKSKEPSPVEVTDLP